MMGFGSGYFLTKITPQGSIVWQDNLLSGATIYSLFCNTDENIYLAGKLSDNLYVAKYDSSGTLADSKTFYMLNYEEFRAVTADTFNNVYLTGYTSVTHSSDTNYDYIVIKTDSALPVQCNMG